ncbi:hypothetical protein QCO44_08835 [Selenomonas sputigena]|uniref:DUF2007 domain-containing protein n=1 Tax=Selenomonas sputigena TaxID=69823 RepID=A0ABV3X6B6_9FIRM
MWTSIFVASTKEQADKICERLEAEGILTNRKSVGGPRKGNFEIRVLESEVEEARDIVCNAPNR